MAPGKNFFPMAKGEKIALVTLIAFAVASFLLVGRTTEIAGMALFGWLMAGLMVLSPILTLWVYRRRPPRS